MHSLPVTGSPTAGGIYHSWARHRHPKSTVYIRIHSQWCTFCGFGNVRHDMYSTFFFIYCEKYKWLTNPKYFSPARALVIWKSVVLCVQKAQSTKSSCLLGLYTLYWNIYEWNNMSGMILKMTWRKRRGCGYWNKIAPELTFVEVGWWDLGVHYNILSTFLFIWKFPWIQAFSLKAHSWEIYKQILAVTRTAL